MKRNAFTLVLSQRSNFLFSFKKNIFVKFFYLKNKKFPLKVFWTKRLALNLSQEVEIICPKITLRSKMSQMFHGFSTPIKTKMSSKKKRMIHV